MTKEEIISLIESEEYGKAWHALGELTHHKSATMSTNGVTDPTPPPPPPEDGDTGDSGGNGPGPKHP